MPYVVPMTYIDARTHLLNLLPVIAVAAASASTKRSDYIRGIRNALTLAQGNLCAGCGGSLIGARVELCHIIPFAYGKGLTPGNAYAGCKECNDYDREACQGDAVTVVTRMARPDLVQTVWPTHAEALALSGNGRAESVRNTRDALA